MDIQDNDINNGSVIIKRRSSKDNLIEVTVLCSDCEEKLFKCIETISELRFFEPITHCGKVRTREIKYYVW